jgi:archaemetzincin
MTDISLVCFHLEECPLIPPIIDALKTSLSVNANVRNINQDIRPFFNPERHQYDASGIISHFEAQNQNGKTILLTGIDLYIPIFTFVFGLAKLKGTTAIVSAHRLRTDFYGLPGDEEILKQRLVKEIIHELGHLLNLRHCVNYYCVMASSNTADDLDIKGDRYCENCLNILEQNSMINPP